MIQLPVKQTRYTFVIRDSYRGIFSIEILAYRPNDRRRFLLEIEISSDHITLN